MYPKYLKNSPQWLSFMIKANKWGANYNATIGNFNLANECLVKAMKYQRIVDSAKTSFKSNRFLTN